MGEIKSVTFKASEKEIAMMLEMKEYLEQTYGGDVSKTEAWIGLVHFGYTWMNTTKAEIAAAVKKETATTAELPVEAPQNTYLSNKRRPFDLDYYKAMANK